MAICACLKVLFFKRPCRDLIRTFISQSTVRESAVGHKVWTNCRPASLCFSRRNIALEEVRLYFECSVENGLMSHKLFSEVGRSKSNWINVQLCMDGKSGVRWGCAKKENGN